MNNKFFFLKLCIVFILTISCKNTAFASANNIDDFVIEDGVLVKYIGDDEEVVIPGNVTKIGFMAFEQANSKRYLKKVDIPEGVISIGERAFRDCVFLRRVNLPDSLITIDKSAFEQCNNLRYINFPPNLSSIGIWAFAGCDSLGYVQLPENLTSIGAFSFSGCGGLIDPHVKTSFEKASEKTGGYASAAKPLLL